MPRVLLGITGSVAAIRAPALMRQLLEDGHEVKAVATRAARYFFDPAEFGRNPSKAASFDRDRLFLDEDEWPGDRYERDQTILHIDLAAFRAGLAPRGGASARAPNHARQQMA